MPSTTKKQLVRKPPEPEFVPSFLLTPIGALNMVGTVLYGPKWMGQEIDADESDTAARERLDGAWRKLRDLACSKIVRTGVGVKGPAISHDRWAMDDAYKIFNEGRTSQGREGAWDYHVTEDWVYLSRIDMVKALKPGADTSGLSSPWLLWSMSPPERFTSDLGGSGEPPTHPAATVVTEGNDTAQGGNEEAKARNGTQEPENRDGAAADGNILGRTIGTGYQKKDAPLLKEMRKLILAGDANGPWQASAKVWKKAVGGGVEDSKRKRLATAYKAKHGAQNNSE
jgi:hypothetical protein